MANLTVHKTVASLPVPLENNALYLVRVGAGFDIYTTNAVGGVTAYPLNTTSGSLSGAVVVTVDFGQTEDGIITNTITGISWVTLTTKFFTQIIDSTDHNVEESLLDGVSIQILNVVNGVGFDIVAVATNGTTGLHSFLVVGV